MICTAMWIATVALSAPADEKPISSTTIEGHSISIQSVGSAPSRVGADGNPGKELTIGFAAEPKDAAKSYGYEIGQRFVSESIIGSCFTGQIVEETRVGDYRAIVPQVAGAAYLTGFHHFVLDPNDPFPQGFSLSEPD